MRWLNPRAVSNLLHWLAEVYPSIAPDVFVRPEIRGRVAIVTDHDAMARGQRRWDSQFGGFSSSYFLNGAFCSMYDEGWDTEVFIVPGILNIADDISRNLGGASRKIGAWGYEGVFPRLGEYCHPYAEGSRTRPEFMV